MTAPLAATIDDRTIGEYLAALSNGTPTPGGGSAAGVSGALGCALGSMVCNLTLARAQTERIVEIQRTLIELQASMLRQAESDERVFGAYRAATALPHETVEEKAVRRSAIEEALVEAARVPESLVILGLQAISTLAEAAAEGSSHALGDLLTGGSLVRAMIEGSLVNIDANAHLMKLSSNRERFAQAAESGRADLGAAMQALESAVAARFA